MAKRQISLNIPNEEEVRHDLKVLGSAAQAYLLAIVEGEAFVPGDHDTTIYNLGRQSLARQILIDVVDFPESKIVKNINE